jgi:hypothetical protein
LFTGVNDNGDKFFGVVIDTAEELSPVSLTLMLNINMPISRQIFKKIQKWNTWEPGGHLFMKKPEVENLVTDSL